MTKISKDIYDCLIIGGGPAGLTAALYLARFRRRVLVLDAGDSRAASISRTHNHPGFADGISGRSLLRILREQAEKYSAEIVSDTVTSLNDGDGTFEAHTKHNRLKARYIVLATGITDRSPDIEHSDTGVLREKVRFCPVCDGFEATNKRIAVYGPFNQAAPKARFLRAYSPSVTLIPTQSHPTPNAEEPFEVAATATTIYAHAGGLDVTLSDGRTKRFDLLYPAMGCLPHAQLASSLGAKTNDVVVSDLHQLVVAEAHAAIAATAIHNRLPQLFAS
jgi:thioredoxin reductase (NADPH)